MRSLTKLESLQSTYSDLFKDVHGFRPRHDATENWNSEEFLEARISELSKDLVRVMAEEEVRANENAAIVEARIVSYMSLGARDRETAIAWLMDAEGADGDYDYLCYLVGIPYGYFNRKAA